MEKNHCATCVRRNESMIKNPTCKACWAHELKTGEKFTNHEKRD